MTRERGRSPFLERMREAIHVRHYSIPTEQARLFWGRRFILFHCKRRPAKMTAFLAHLSV